MECGLIALFFGIFWNKQRLRILWYSVLLCFMEMTSMLAVHT